jgi:putative FmdB family regulatory protein
MLDSSSNPQKLQSCGNLPAHTQPQSPPSAACNPHRGIQDRGPFTKTNQLTTMPTYDYACEKCGHEFEVFQSMNDARLTKCPQKGCRGKVERKIGMGAGFVFKGSGFYITDYRSEGYKAAAKSEAGAGDAAKPAADAGSSAKSETKAEPKPKKEKAAK